MENNQPPTHTQKNLYKPYEHWKTVHWKTEHWSAHTFDYMVLRVKPGLTSCGDLAMPLMVMLDRVCGTEFSNTHLNYNGVLLVFQYLC